MTPSPLAKKGAGKKRDASQPPLGDFFKRQKETDEMGLGSLTTPETPSPVTSPDPPSYATSDFAPTTPGTFEKDDFQRTMQDIEKELQPNDALKAVAQEVRERDQARSDKDTFVEEQTPHDGKAKKRVKKWARGN